MDFSVLHVPKGHVLPITSRWGGWVLLIIMEFGVVSETYNSRLAFISPDMCRWADELKSLNVY